MLKSFAGKTMHLTEWAKEYKIQYPTLMGRLKAGWPFETALMSRIDVDKRPLDFCDRELCELNKMPVITADNVDVLV
jgi:hypothetical protein